MNELREVTLIRSYLSDRTVGIMKQDEVFSFCSLERPWLDNKPFESCIPEGKYLVKRDRTGRHQYYRLEGVVQRSDIEIHVANKVSQLLGCIGLGTEFNGRYDLVNSQLACDEFTSVVGDEDFYLTIRQANPILDKVLP